MAEKKSVNPLEAGVVGAIIGAAATAAAVVLSDEKNRKKAEQILNDLQKKGDKIIKEISKKALEIKDQTQPAYQAGLKKLKVIAGPRKSSKKGKK